MWQTQTDIVSFSDQQNRGRGIALTPSTSTRLTHCLSSRDPDLVLYSRPSGSLGAVQASPCVSQWPPSPSCDFISRLAKSTLPEITVHEDLMTFKFRMHA
jgi:hypothetical protein